MDASPLTLAHDHARAASNATHSSDTTVAISEHTAAAGEFAKAAETTGSAEALRTLKLLEQHHQRLSELLKLPEDNPIKPNIESQSEEVVGPTSDDASSPDAKSTKNDAILREHPRRTKPGASGIYVPRRLPSREMSSSIASNLASARGIRSGHERRALSPSVTTRQAPGSLEIPARRSSQIKPAGIPSPVAGRPTWLPPVTEASKAEAQVSISKAERVAAPAPTAAEEGFQRWTSTFGNLISKISAPLAFAGLPLTTEEPAVVENKEPHPKHKRPSSSASASGEPDLGKIFSKSALSTLHHQNAGGDSFYVVPTAGHTVSYANILSFAEKEKRRMAASIHSTGRTSFDDQENEDFVDARETITPQTSSLSRMGLKSNTKAKDLENMIEELYMENKSLKDCIDKLTKRLHSFEMAAQSSGLAMQESMRFNRPPSPQSSRDGGAKGQAILEGQIHNLSEQLEASQKEMQKLGRENDKLRSVVQRYRDRWEKLKEGAKTRRSEVGGGASTPRERDQLMDNEAAG